MRVLRIGLLSSELRSLHLRCASPPPPTRTHTLACSRGHALEEMESPPPLRAIPAQRPDCHLHLPPTPAILTCHPPRPPTPAHPPQHAHGRLAQRGHQLPALPAFHLGAHPALRHVLGHPDRGAHALPPSLLPGGCVGCGRPAGLCLCCAVAAGTWYGILHACFSLLSYLTIIPPPTPHTTTHHQPRTSRRW